VNHEPDTDSSMGRVPAAAAAGSAPRRTAPPLSPAVDRSASRGSTSHFRPDAPELLDSTLALNDTRVSTPASVVVLNHRRDVLDHWHEPIRAAGYAVTSIDSLAEAAEFLLDEESRPDCVIWNPLAPQLDGVELDLLTQLQTEHDSVPVVALVESPSAVTERVGRLLPCLDFVLRPVEIAELVSRVRLSLARRQRLRELRSRTRELEGQVTQDFKTELLSERYFKRRLDLEFKRARRHRYPLSLLLIDVDDFKSVNDSTEYAFGDEVLRAVAKVLKGSIRETDAAARFGGDEFVVLLPHATPTAAVQTALRISNSIRKEPIRSSRYSKQITVSIGIDTYDGQSESTPPELRRHANRALQDAKRRGKNKVWLYASDDGAPGAVASGD
jgi:two-component system cell cycle response regulator